MIRRPIAHTDIGGLAELNSYVFVPISTYQNDKTQYLVVNHLNTNSLETTQPAFDCGGGITLAGAVATLCEVHGSGWLKRSSHQLNACSVPPCLRDVGISNTERWCSKMPTTMFVR